MAFLEEVQLSIADYQLIFRQILIENKMKLELAPRPVPVEQSKFVLQEILLKSYGE